MPYSINWNQINKARPIARGGKGASILGGEEQRHSVKEGVRGGT